MQRVARSLRTIAAGHAPLLVQGRGAGRWLWSAVQEAPKDPILGVSERFVACTVPQKMNLGVGAYRDDDGKPVVLGCVRAAEKKIAGLKNMEYLPMGGSKEFCVMSAKLALGDDSPYIKSGQVASVQTLSGTGACRIFADFQSRFAPKSAIYIPVPTWSNHHSIWQDAAGGAGVPQATYRYYKPSTRGLDLAGMLSDIAAAPKGSFFLLHACAHNPTGVDPTPEQWRAISAAMKEFGHHAMFDMAYQGFASGDCERDAGALRTFVADGHLVACAQSYAKNMGLYGQRVGCLSVICKSPKEAAAVESQLKLIARPMYSNPPLHGALIVSTILGDAQLKAQWLGEVKGMAERIISMRRLLRGELEAAGSQLPWAHVTDQIGMFCYTGMAPAQVDRLEAEHNIFMTRNGRISMAGVNTKNVGRLAAAIHAVTK